MPMYNLLEYHKNYRKTTGSLWNYYRDQPNNPFSSDSESFKYKTSITENTYNVGDVEVTQVSLTLRVPTVFLNFRRNAANFAVLICSTLANW